MIGLGAMGSALAKALLAADLGVTVWNRSPDKCEALVGDGAMVADSISEAVDRSEVIVVCVRGYDVANDLFRDQGIAALLADKIVVQLGNGVPAEVSHAAHWFSERGAAYIDGSIMTFPDAVGSADCQVLASGDPVAFERCRPVFDAIGGDIRFLGNDPAASAVINSSGLAFVYLTAHAFISAAALCDAADAPLDLLAESVGNFMTQMPTMFAEYVEMIGRSTYDSTSLRLASGKDNLGAIAEFGRDRGVDVGLIDAALRAFDASASAEHGVNLASIFETLRTAAR